MIKELKYFIFSIVILTFIFFSVKYYFSDTHKKKSYRSLSNLEKEINLYSQKLPILEDDTQKIIEYVENTKIIKKKKYFFWELLNKNEE